MTNRVKELIEALNTFSKKTEPYDEKGVVRRVEGKTAWVRLNGGVDETPVEKTIDCKPGDVVRVRVGGGSAWMAGNESAPPTDNGLAREALKKAIAAGKTATGYITDMKDGIFVHPADDDKSGWKITNVIELLKDGVSYIWVGLATGTPTMRIGRADNGHTNVDANGMRVYGGDGTTQLANIGYGEGKSASGSNSPAPYYTFGVRAGGVGNYSVAEGHNVTASSYCAHASGEDCYASARAAHAFGAGLRADRNGQFVAGTFNKRNVNALFTVGDGTADDARSDAFNILPNGKADVRTGYFIGGRPIFKVAQKTLDNWEINANTAADNTIDIYMDGYKPVALVGYDIDQASTSGTNVTMCRILAVDIINNGCVFQVKNDASTTARIKLKARILYIDLGMMLTA